MFKFCDKKFSSNKILNLIQSFSCWIKHHAHKVREYTHHLHKRMIHHVYHKKHNRLTYIHIVFLLLLFYFYQITSFNFAQEVTVPLESAPVVIQNEPEIIPEVVPAEQIPPTEIPTSGELLPAPSEIFS